ncbi:ABC transporter ATP-binding protein [Cytophagaceae bacterium YF14B1]|uniref:ABC transporter ATP-binding protein n=1 Tax=Xanthocytophaga flava TaxID=3048013 RepID=A0AAE3QLG1_9BACT|nr:ABC transporter ATP-binding protein [Xanthocytophaga flavus]MDJ1481512.1 ABC transporter ATP-binding protein [Xanthocytophaga flavus]
MNILTVKDLNKTYSGQFDPAIKNITLAVKKGEIFGLVGESGSGKTTLLRIIAGLEDADSGSVRLLKEAITGPSRNLVPGHTHIRLVHQNFNLQPNISIRHNILYSLKGYDLQYQLDRLDKMIDLCDLSALQHKLPRQLSGGEMQRVALARALADEPMLLLLDEPFSNVDILRRQELKQEVSDIIRKSGTTAIFVTHDTTEALTLSDTIGVMRDGSLIQIGTPHHIYNQPATPYVASFFGNANIISISKLQPYLRIKQHASLFNKQDVVCIRAESIQICQETEADLTGKLKKVYYLGMYELWDVQIARNISLHLLHFQKTPPPEKLFLKIVWEQVHAFN